MKALHNVLFNATMEDHHECIEKVKDQIFPDHKNKETELSKIILQIGDKNISSKIEELFMSLEIIYIESGFVAGIKKTIECLKDWLQWKKTIEYDSLF